MKKITTMVITVSSQLLVVFVFLFLLFGTVGSNKNVTIIANNNFNAENIQNYYIVVMNYFLYLKILPNKLPEFFLPISSLL